MAYLYLLQDAHQPLFKLGTSIDTAARAQCLVDPLDWSRSRQVKFPSREAALKAEKFMHHLLAEYRKPKPHKKDGYTEWFADDAFPLAVGFLRDNKLLLKCSNVVGVPLRRQVQFDALIAENIQRTTTHRMLTRADWKASPAVSFDYWLETREDVTFRKLSLHTYRTLFGVWLRFLTSNSLCLLSIDEPTVLAFAKHLGIDSTAVYRYLLLLRKLYADLVAVGFVTANPITSALLDAFPERRKLTPILSSDEVGRLREALLTIPGWRGHRDRAIAAVLVGAGLRVGELQQAKPSDFDSDRGSFFVARQGLVFAHDTIVLPDWLNYLKQWHALREDLGIPGEILFPAARNGKPITSSGLFRRIDTWFDLAGIAPERGGGELLRNTFGHTVLGAYSIGEVQEFMGIETERAVRRYLDLVTC